MCTQKHLSPHTCTLTHKHSLVFITCRTQTAAESELPRRKSKSKPAEDGPQPSLESRPKKDATRGPGDELEEASKTKVDRDAEKRKGGADEDQDSARAYKPKHKNTDKQRGDTDEDQDSERGYKPKQRNTEKRKGDADDDEDTDGALQRKGRDAEKSEKRKEDVRSKPKSVVREEKPKSVVPSEKPKAKAGKRDAIDDYIDRIDNPDAFREEDKPLADIWDEGPVSTHSTIRTSRAGGRSGGSLAKEQVRVQVRVLFWGFWMCGWCWWDLLGTSDRVLFVTCVFARMYIFWGGTIVCSSVFLCVLCRRKLLYEFVSMVL